MHENENLFKLIEENGMDFYQFSKMTNKLVKESLYIKEMLNDGEILVKDIPCQVAKKLINFYNSCEINLKEQNIAFVPEESLTYLKLEIPIDFYVSVTPNNKMWSFSIKPVFFKGGNEVPIYKLSPHDFLIKEKDEDSGKETLGISPTIIKQDVDLIVVTIEALPCIDANIEISKTLRQVSQKECYFKENKKTLMKLARKNAVEWDILDW